MTVELGAAAMWREGELSRLQQGMWLEQTRNPALTDYNQVLPLRLPRRVDVDVLGRAWERVIKRHAALRTTFHPGEKGPVRRVHDEGGSEVLEYRVRGMGDAELVELAKERTREPFPLESVTSRVRLFEVGAADSLLVFSCHHLISDAVSWDVITRELALAYESLEGGAEPAFAATATATYDEFVDWEREVLSGPRGRELEAFWQKELVDAPRLALETDHPRSRSVERSGCLSFSIDEDMTRALRVLAAGASMFRTILATYAALLARYTGQRELVVHTPASIRTERFNDVVGPFVNDIVIRARVPPDDRFTDVLAAVGEATKRAGRHRDLPFADIVRVARPARDPTRAVLREASFLIVPELPGRVLAGLPIELGVLSGRGWAVPQQEGSNDIDLRVAEGNGRVHCELHYRLDLFDPPTMERIARSWRTMLRSIADDPTRRIRDLELVSPEERRALVARSQPTARPSPSAPTRCAHELFERWARDTPDAVALIEGDRRVTYGAANVWANRVAQDVRAAGANREARVGLLAPRSIEAFIGILGILKAGAVYVPVDPGLPRARQARLLDRCGVRVLLTSREPAGLVPAELAIERRDASGGHGPDPCIAVAVDQAMVVLHTSGSTGEPKAVVLSHRGLVDYVASLGRAWQLTAADSVLQFASLSFDVSLEEMLLAWTSGGRLVLRDERMLDPRSLFAACRAYEVTVLDLPAAYFARVVEAAEEAGGWPPSIRVVVVGGERAPAGSFERFHRAPSRPRLFNMYGPTEASISVTACDTGRFAGVRGEPMESILGQPVEHAAVYVLDDRMSLVPAGVVGELCVGGTSPLARGYLGEPALTAAAFVPDPFAEGQRLYRTGDQARWRSDDTLEFVGRRDEQVKIRGFRIEPAEIEATLGRHPDVAEAVVLVVDGAPGGARLVAYVRSSGKATAQDLRRFAAEHLPGYMVPSLFALVEAWPTMVSGKVDRRALAAMPLASTADAAAQPASPMTDLERTIAGIWSELLGVESVQRDAHFLELGGHSLLALQVISRVRQALGVEVPLDAFFQALTVAELAAVVEARMGHAGPAPTASSAAVDLASEARDAIEPVSTPIRPAGAGPWPRMRHALLTGATGFLGSHLLTEILARTDATVRCVVRGADARGARRRLERALEVYGQGKEPLSDRVEVLAGDVSAPRLGLTRETYEVVADGSDAIFHAASWVNVTAGYHDLKPANVAGTREILALAARGELSPPVHFVSTASVLSSMEQPVLEGLDLAAGPLLHGGYDQTKWVADRMVQLARARGVRANVYRPGWISGNTATGVCNEKDLFWNLVKACVELGAAPEVELEVPFVPVDVAAAIVVHVALAGEGSGADFHVPERGVLRLTDVIQLLGSRGRSVDWLPAATWRERLLARPTTTALGPFRSMIEGSDHDLSGLSARPVRMDCARTRERIRTLSLADVPVPALIARYVDYLSGSGFLPGQNFQPRGG